MLIVTAKNIKYNIFNVSWVRERSWKWSVYLNLKRILEGSFYHQGSISYEILQFVKLTIVLIKYINNLFTHGFDLYLANSKNMNYIAVIFKHFKHNIFPLSIIYVNHVWCCTI